MKALFLENPTAAAAIIAAIAAIVAPTIAAHITERGKTNRKALELLFYEKIAVYKEFLHFSGKFFNNPLDIESLNSLRSTMDRALLLSTPKTYLAINSFISLLFEIQPPSYSCEQMEKISAAHSAVIHALRAELSEYNVYKRRLHRLKLWIAENK